MSVRICIVGDEKVGKTSIVKNLMGVGGTGEKIMDVIPETVIPASATVEGVETHIIDTGSKARDEKMVSKEIKRADVIILMFDVSREETGRGIVERWIPKIRQCREDKLVPILCVGNKVDLVDDKEYQQEMMDAVSGYQEMEAIMWIQSDDVSSLSQLFLNAQRLALYPIRPLFDSNERALTKPCMSCWSRIFHIVDVDGDGLLNRAEYYAFYRKVFGEEISNEEMNATYSSILSLASDGILDGDITETGFFMIAVMYVENGMEKRLWSVLQRFGYLRSLQLDPAYYDPVLPVDVKESGVELNGDGIMFLSRVLEKYLRKGVTRVGPQGLRRLANDYIVDDEELKEIVVGGVPYVQDRDAGEGGITVSGWIGKWQSIIHKEPKVVMKLLAYLGFEGSPAFALQIHAKWVSPACEPTVRTTFVIGMIGEYQEEMIAVMAREEGVVRQGLYFHYKGKVIVVVDATSYGVQYCDTLLAAYDGRSVDTLKDTLASVDLMRRRDIPSISCSVLCLHAKEQGEGKYRGVSVSTIVDKMGLVWLEDGVEVEALVVQMMGAPGWKTLRKQNKVNTFTAGVTTVLLTGIGVAGLYYLYKKYTSATPSPAGAQSSPTLFAQGVPPPK